jgi:RNA polymerase sigma-70 factor (ECF subfamily)
MFPSRPLDAELLLSHGAWLAQLARALVAKEDEVDDVVQQTYAQALAQPPRHFENVRAWLGAIARNVVRARNRSDVARMSREEFAPRPTPAESPEEAIERMELRRAVVDAVLALPEPYRSALVLRFFEELPASEIARLTKSPQETVKTRIKRGLAQLRVMLSERFSRHGESLMEGLAMLLVPAMAGSSVSGSGGSAATTTTASAGGGGVVIGSGVRLLIAAATVLVVGAATWRWTVLHRAAHATEPVAVHAAAPTPTTAAEPPLAAATRIPETASDPDAAAAGDVSAEEFVPFDFDGRVVDAHGAAVADALVLLGDANSIWARPALGRNEGITMYADGLLTGRTRPEKLGARGTRSAADGSFRFEKVDSDHRFELFALHESAGLGRAHAPTSDAKGTLVVTLAPMIVVHGRIAEGDGSVSADAKLDIRVSYDAVRSGTGGAIVATDGTFRCFWSDIDAVTFVARAADGRESEKVKLDFGPNDPRDRNVALVMAASGGGRCHGRIVDKSGAPLKLREQLLPRLTEAERADGGARSVRLFTCSGESAPPPDFEPGALVDLGTIDIDAGTYDAVLSKEVRWIALVVRNRTLGAVAASSAKPGANGRDLVVDLSRLPAAPAGAAVELRLIDAQSGALFTGPDAVVELMSVHGDPDQKEAGTMTGSSIGSSSRRRITAGVVTIDSVHPGHCRLTVEIDGMAPIHREFDVVARAEPYRIDLTVRPADAVLRGLVVDPDGKPLVKAHVRLLERTKSGLDADNVPPTLTNGEGRFIFEKLASGDGVLIVYALPFAPAIVPVKLAADGDAGSIKLAAGSRVVVTVSRARGDPKQSSFSDVHAFRTADSVPLVEPGWEGSVDWKTATRLELVLPPGRATLDVTLIDGTKLHKEVDVVAGKAQELTID